MKSSVQTRKLKCTHLKLEKAVEGVDGGNAAKLEAEQCRAKVLGAIAWCLSNENEVGSERPCCLKGVDLVIKLY